jgi:hypothetical protein
VSLLLLILLFSIFRLIDQLKGQSIGVLMSLFVLLLVDVAAVLVVFVRYRPLPPD